MILITGANGLVGRALTEQLMSSQKLRLQVRRKNSLERVFPAIANNTHIEIVESEFSRAQSQDFERLVDGCSTVIHWCRSCPSAPSN